MDDRSQIADTNYMIRQAQACAPNDFITKAAILATTVVTKGLVVLLPIEMVTTAVGGCLIALTFGLFSFVLSLIWWPFLGFLLGTSWLWLRAWYVRPILLVPGVTVATVATIYVMLAPDPERGAKYAKLSIAGEWPLSWYLIRPPARHYDEAEAELDYDPWYHSYLRQWLVARQERHHEAEAELDSEETSGGPAHTLEEVQEFIKEKQRLGVWPIEASELAGLPMIIRSKPSLTSESAGGLQPGKPRTTERRSDVQSSLPDNGKSSASGGGWWRWPLILPAFYVGLFLPPIVVGLFLLPIVPVLTLTWFLPKLVIVTVQALLSGYFAVFLPGKVAPRGKFVVGLLALVVLAVLVAFLPEMPDSDPESNVLALSGLVTGAIALYQLRPVNHSIAP